MAPPSPGPISPVIQRCNVCEEMKCNKPTFQLYFANCGHLICDNCRTSDTCPVCDKETSYVKIDEELPQNLKLFFENPSPMIKLYGKIVEFQNLQSGISHKQLQQQNKNLRQKVTQLQKQVKDKSKEVEHLKARCSNLEIELDRRNELVKAITKVDEKMLTKKKMETNNENKFSNYAYKPVETKSTFFDPSQIDRSKEKNDENKKSLSNDSVKSTVSLPMQPNPAIQQFIKQRKNNINKNKFVYDTLNFNLQ